MSSGEGKGGYLGNEYRTVLSRVRIMKGTSTPEQILDQRGKLWVRKKFLIKNYKIYLFLSPARRSFDVIIS